MRAFLVVSFIAVIATACSAPAPPPEPVETALELQLPDGFEAAAETIQPPGMLADVSYLASDELEGRGPGSDGDRAAREYLAGRLGEMGFEPYFVGGSWEQPFEIVGVTGNFPELWTFNGPDGATESYSYADEYMVTTGVQRPEVTIDNAEVVFVGYGIQAPEEDWDDFKGVDVSGKVLLMLNDDPHWDPEIFAGERKLYYGRWRYKYESAARQGAAAALIVHTTPSAGYPWGVVRSSNIGEQFVLPETDGPHTLVNGYLTEDASRRLVAMAGYELEALFEAARSRDFEPIPLGVTTTLNFTNDMRTTSTANVAGILRGSDPELADEIMVYSAHHDHLGIGEPDETGDDIYNGALDNGVAMSQALAVAGAFATLPERPRRSVMIFFCAAEEQGLLGSRYFTTSDAVEPGRLVANINFELGNIWGPTRDVMIYGMGKSELDDWVEAAARTQGRTVRAEQDVRAGWYYRSDHFSFARVGVPAMWFKSGVDFIGHDEAWGEQQYADWIAYKYHQPADEVEDDWNLEGLAEDARLAFRVGSAVTTVDVTPTWYPGDEFEDEREASLAALESKP
ncbi:MAG: M28 family peptidase [Thermoanaerobaculales bacterium]|nr:M28 family peptidase [Thermoanaerobaculales bacterium]